MEDVPISIRRDCGQLAALWTAHQSAHGTSLTPLPGAPEISIWEWGLWDL